MLNKIELEKKIAEIEKMIKEKCVAPPEKEVIGDGIVDVDCYLNAKFKILWILKEAYCEDGGGWDYSELMEEKLSELVNGSSRPTWHPVIYVCYSILNDFLTWKEMDYIRDDPKMAEVLRSIAFINVNKLPGLSRSNDENILEFYQENKSIILKQIEAFQPDIVIGHYKVLREIYSDLGVSEKKKEEEEEEKSCEYVKTPERLYITIYHPAQTTFSREKYVNDIIEAAKEWNESKGEQA